MWQDYHCRWIGTHRDGNRLRKLWYFGKAFLLFVVLLPFYDIVHFHFSLTNSAKRKYPLFRLTKFFGKKTVLHLHCGSQIDDIWNDIYQTMFEQCDCGILLSESLRYKVEKHIGIVDKMKVVYNPCPLISDNVQYKKQNVILFSGTLYEGKGYMDLIRAFGKIASLYREWKVVLAGNGEIEQARSLSSELGIAGQVEILGWVSGEEKNRVFCEAKALCLPSYAEGFPMAVLDAWAYGLPVITTPVGGIPDVAIDGENMLLFPPGDVDVLVKKLEMVINNENLRDNLSKESLKMAQYTFNLKTVTKQVREIYEKIMING